MADTDRVYGNGGRETAEKGRSFWKSRGGGAFEQNFLVK